MSSLDLVMGREHSHNLGVVWGFRIVGNWIDVIGGGTTAVGIHCANTGTGHACFVTGNHVVTLTGCTNALITAQHGCLNNHVSIGGVATGTAVEVWGDDDG